ncbi:MAG: glycoside hydrolase family 2 protein, partial [Planctomycetota bacterium]
MDRRYGRTVQVPGLATDPTRVNKGTLWYKRKVKLPQGNWTHATLVLNGARFCPAIYVNGEKISEAPGGMTVTTHLLRSPHLAPGKSIVLEVSLKSLKDVDPRDASRIPKADQWRSNLSSCLWDNVTLRLHGPERITRLIPSSDLENDRVSVKWEFEELATGLQGLSLRFEVLSTKGEKMAEARARNARTRGTAQIPLRGRCRYWSPDNPVTYRLRATLSDGSRTLDVWEITLGIREFRTRGLGFRLNGKPIQMRGGTVVWQRWLRDPEARELAFDVKWFEKNVVLRLKEHGANTLHFSLYTPPEAFLDLCDKHGLLVQHEWIFFHGVEASKESMIEQWRAWLDLAMRHPSVVIIHAWNETESDELEAAWAAMESLCPEYPPLVVSHRDVTHVHKYWWSMFENLGLYYDSAAQ